jgi:hypothetical protein
MKEALPLHNVQPSECRYGCFIVREFVGAWWPVRCEGRVMLGVRQAVIQVTLLDIY